MIRYRNNNSHYLFQAPKINGLPIAVDISEDTNVVTTLYTLSVTDPENVAVECTLTSITPTSTFFYEKPSANFNGKFSGVSFQQHMI